MRSTKLIFVEGLPGLGKTTTAAWVATRLQSECLAVNLFEEHQPGHPLNVGGDLHPAGDMPGKAFFQRYTAANFIQESYEKWQVFVRAAAKTEVTSVLDSYPFQNAVRILLQLDTPPDVIRNYAAEVEELVMPLQPVLIYFKHRDTSSAIDHLNHISAQRGQAWADYVVDLVTSCPYAASRRLEGPGGVVQFVIAYKELADALANGSCFPRLVLEHGATSWAECYRQIETFLGLSQLAQCG